jgi:hypothetical protein
MSDEGRALRWAKEVWRENAPSDAELRSGADRVARKFAAPRRPIHLRKGWQAAGATAVVLGALVYAGRGVWQPRVGPRGGAAIPNETPVPIVLPATHEGPAVPEPPAPQLDSQLPSGAELPAEVPSKREPANAPAGTGAKRHRTDVAPRAPVEPLLDQPTWVDVSNALAAHDHALAERLLVELTGQEHDADTRAKAYLGLAQLDESRGNCERARQRALVAASVPEVEIKTVRRALELAARCAR